VTATIEVDGERADGEGYATGCLGGRSPGMATRIVAANREAAADQSVESQDPGPLPDETEGADERWLPFQRLDVYRVAEELVRLVHEAKITDAESGSGHSRGQADLPGAL